MEGMLDLVVVGAGPVGIAAGIEAKRKGLAVRLLERGTVAHTVYRFPLDMVFFSEARKIEVGGHPFVSLGPKPTRKEALTYYRRVVEAEGLEVWTYTEVTRIEGREGAFRVHYQNREGAGHLEARYVLVATGYFDAPNRLGVPGEELPHVTYRYTEAAPYWGRRVVVVGGSNSAVETALDLYRGGARVTLVHRGPSVRPGVKYWLRPDFENRVKEGAIRAVYNARVTEITPRAVVVARMGERLEVPADFVVVQIGYRAVDDLIRSAGARYEGDKPLLSEAFETSVPGLFVAGSAGFGANTRTVFIENGREHAAQAVAEIARRLEAAGVEG